MSPPIDPLILKRNLAALEVASPEVAALVAASPPADVDLEGVYRGARLASRFPLVEADALASTIDLIGCSLVLVPGFGLGYHCTALAGRIEAAMGGRPMTSPWGAMLVYEPDIPLLRAVMERIDHHEWILLGHVAFVAQATNAAVAVAMTDREVDPWLGNAVGVMEHPGQRVRLGPGGTDFLRACIEWLEAQRTQAVTNIDLAKMSTQNQLMNIDRYVSQPSWTGADLLRWVPETCGPGPLCTGWPTTATPFAASIADP